MSWLFALNLVTGGVIGSALTVFYFVASQRID